MREKEKPAKEIADEGRQTTDFISQTTDYRNGMLTKKKEKEAKKEECL